METKTIKDETQVKLSSRKAPVTSQYVATRAEEVNGDKEYVVLEDMNTHEAVNSVKYEDGMNQMKVGKELAEEMN